MRRLLIGLLLLTCCLPACRLAFPDAAGSTVAPSIPTITSTFAPITPQETAASLSGLQDSLAAADFSLRWHPDGGLYPGDQVSFEVIAPPGIDMKGQSARIDIGPPASVSLQDQEFGYFGIARRLQATFEWAWDTSGLPDGDYAVTVSVLPAGVTWTELVRLLPASPPTGRWAVAESDCCLLYYITGTPAERDLSHLVEMADFQAQMASRRMGADFEGPVSIVFLPRVLGHGGFANEEISISYLDRNYAGGNPEIVLHHEMIHILDRQLGGEYKPSLLVEGLAVYLSGGHFKTEPLASRAAALLELGWYLPLAPLTERFYTAQHEIGYLEAGALVEYMIGRWGRAAFDRFYRQIRPAEGVSSQAAALNNALLEHFHLTLGDLENDFIRYLKEKPPDPTWIEDVRLTVQFYDTVRRYQQALDPSAYYLTAWLPDGKEMRQRGIVADYLRAPSAPENVAIETLLVAAEERLRSGDPDEAERLLQIAGAVLDTIEAR